MKKVFMLVAMLLSVQMLSACDCYKNEIVTNHNQLKVGMRVLAVESKTLDQSYVGCTFKVLKIECPYIWVNMLSDDDEDSWWINACQNKQLNLKEHKFKIIYSPPKPHKCQF